MSSEQAPIEAGRPVVLRGGTVLTMNDAHDVLHDADVLVVGDRIAAVGPGPRGAGGHLRDRRRGRHRDAGHDRHAPAHVADRAARLRRRLDAEPVLRLLLPRVGEDLPPAGHPRGQPAVGDRVARRRRDDDRRLVARAPDRSTTPTPRSTRSQAVPGRFVLAYGNIQQGPWEWATSPDFRRFVDRRFGTGDDMLGFQMAFDVTGDPAFPEQDAFKVARELGVPVTTHAGVWGATNDDGIRLMHEHGFMAPGEHLRPRGDARRGLLPPDRGDRRLGVGLDRERAERRPGLPADLAAAPPRHPGVAVDGHERVVERRPVLARCARRSAPTARASTSRRTRARRRSRTTTCAPSRSSTGRRAAAAGRCGSTRSIGSLEPGKKADVVLIRNDDSPVMFPVLHPYGHVAFQAQRGDVHTVLVNGRVVKHDGQAGRHRPRACAPRRSRRPSSSRSSTLGEEAWTNGMHPEIPEHRDPREPVPVHGVGRRLGAVEAGSQPTSTRAGAREHATRCGPTLRVGIRSARCDHAVPPCSRSGRRSPPGCCSRWR